MTGLGGTRRSLRSGLDTLSILKRFTRFLAGLDQPPQSPDQLTAAHVSGFILAGGAALHRDIPALRSILRFAQDPPSGFAARLAQASVPNTDMPAVSYSPDEYQRIIAAARSQLGAAATRIASGRTELAAWRAGLIGQAAEPARWEAARLLDHADRHGDVPRRGSSQTRTYSAQCAGGAAAIFASDIIAAFDEYKHLSVPNYYTRKRESRLVTASARRPRGSVTAMLDGLLGEYRAAGLALPGLRAVDGTVAVNAYHLGRELDAQILPARAAAMAAAAGLPVDDDTYLRAPVTALLDGESWLPHRIRYDQAPVLARHLSTACFVIIAYLTGQRPGETANLERGCLTRDTETGLVLLHGRHFKGATGDDGSHLPEEKIRDDPWVTVEPVATAVTVAGRLHDAQLLFPNTLLVNGSACAGSLGDRVGRAKGQSHIGGDITSLVTWINQYCREQGRLDPPDPADPGLAPGRLRRTLAWFIVRKPRGLVAAAIQYGTSRSR